VTSGIALYAIAAALLAIHARPAWHPYKKDSRFAANVAERFMLTVSNAVNPPLSRKSVSIAERA